MVDDMPAIETLSRPSMKPPQSEVKIFNTPPTLIIPGEPIRKIEILKDSRGYLSVLERSWEADSGALREIEQAGISPAFSAEGLLLNRVQAGDKHALDVLLKPAFLLYGIKAVPEIDEIRLNPSNRVMMAGSMTLLDTCYVKLFREKGLAPYIIRKGLSADGRVESLGFAVGDNEGKGRLESSREDLEKIRFRAGEIEKYRNHGIGLSWGEIEEKKDEAGNVFYEKVLYIRPVQTQNVKLSQAA